jgi:hypothetical protein
MVKLPGAQFKKFWADENYWPANAWVDDESIIIDDIEFDTGELDVMTISDTAVVKLIGGHMAMELNTEEELFNRYNGISFEKFLRKWIKDQAVDTIAIQVPKEKRSELEVWLKENNGKIL